MPDTDQPDGPPERSGGATRQVSVDPHADPAKVVTVPEPEGATDDDD